MKKIILLLILLILVSGCDRLSDCYGCCDCIKINLKQYQGNYYSYYELPMREIGNKDFSVPTNAEIKVCENRSDTTGECENELFRFKLSGEC